MDTNPTRGINGAAAEAKLKPTGLEMSLKEKKRILSVHMSKEKGDCGFAEPPALL